MTRERAIEVLKAWDLNWSDEFTANEFEQAFAMAISALSADVRESIHGEWIDKGSLSCRCSKCGCKSTAETNFCAVCGADMRGGK